MLGGLGHSASDGTVQNSVAVIHNASVIQPSSVDCTAVTGHVEDSINQPPFATDGTSLSDRTSPHEELPIKPVDCMNVELTPPSLMFGESLFEFISLSMCMLTLIQVVDPQFLKCH